MTELPLHLQPETLLRHRAWLRRLAGELVTDPNTADDLTQDTMLAALCQAGPTRARVSTWLAAILRRRAADRRRSQSRSRRHERRAARNESLPGASESLEQFEQVRKIIHAVEQLPKAMRAVVMLRFWDDLPPRQIAARLELPVETVRTRLKRALHRLRLALTTQHGSRLGWVAPLTPILQALPGKAAPLWSGTLMMTSKSKAALALASLLLAAWFGIAVFAAQPTALSSPASTASRAAAIVVPGQSEPSRSSIHAGSLPEHRPDGVRLAGRVLDPGDRPGSRMQLEFTTVDGSAERVRCQTDQAGVFRTKPLAAGSEYRVRIRCGRPLLEATTLLATASRTEPLILRIAARVPRQTIAGIVVDSDGRPVAGMRLRTPHTRFIASDAQGRFTLHRSPEDLHPRTRIQTFWASGGNLPPIAPAVYEWGSTEVTLRLLRQPTFKVRVLRADSRKPVRHYHCRVFNSHAYSTRKEHPDGITNLAWVHSSGDGTERVLVFPKSPNLLSRWIDIDASKPGPHTILLYAPTANRLRITDRSGKALPGVLVEMVRSYLANSPPSFASYPLHRRDGFNLRADLIDVGNTDDNGSLQLRGDSWRSGNSVLLVSGAGICPSIFPTGNAGPSTTTHQLVVDRGATISGSITGLDEFDAEHAELDLRRDQGEIRHLPILRLNAFGSAFQITEGRFHMPHVPAGTWNMRLRVNGEVFQLGEVQVGEGEHRQLQIHARDHLAEPPTGRLQGTILVNGTPAASAVVNPSGFTDAAGKFGPNSVRAGRHSIHLSLRLGGKRVQFTDAAECVVPVGKTRRIAVHLQVVPLRLQLVDAAGRPVGRECVYLYRNGKLHRRASADELGRLRYFVGKGEQFELALQPIDWSLQLLDNPVLSTMQDRLGDQNEGWIRLGRVTADDARLQTIVVH